VRVRSEEHDNMNSYIAFLRGINVGGKNLIKMEDLREVFESLGLRNVRSYIACGNIVFESIDTNSSSLGRKIEKKIEKELEQKVVVLLFKIAEIEEMLKRDPFKRIKANEDVMLCVALLAEEPSMKLSLPLVSAVEKLEVVEVRRRAAFVVARRKKTGWFGFPNNFVEKQLGIRATTRQFTTLQKIIVFSRKTRDG
jgi:uncharacterized protein (DUF1697 family)